MSKRAESESPSGNDKVHLPVGVFTEDRERHQDLIVRRLTGRDRKLLGEPRFKQNPSLLVSSIIASCIVEAPDLNLDNKVDFASKLTCADRNHLILQLRRNSMGPSVTTRLNCPSCSEMNEFEMDIDSLENIELASPDLRGEGKNLFIAQEVHLTDENLTALFRLPTGKDEEAVQSIIRKNPIEGSIALMSRCLLEFNGSKPTRDTLDDLSWSINDKLTAAWSKNLPGPQMLPSLNCWSCGVEIPISIISADFFSVA